jgi:hypothetical protein
MTYRLSCSLFQKCYVFRPVAAHWCPSYSQLASQYISELYQKDLPLPPLKCASCPAGSRDDLMGLLPRDSPDAQNPLLGTQFPATGARVSSREPGERSAHYLLFQQQDSEHSQRMRRLSGAPPGRIAAVEIKNTDRNNKPLQQKTDWNQLASGARRACFSQLLVGSKSVW